MNRYFINGKYIDSEDESGVFMRQPKEVFTVEITKDISDLAEKLHESIKHQFDNVIFVDFKNKRRI